MLAIISTYSENIFPNLHFQKYIESNHLNEFSKNEENVASLNATLHGTSHTQYSNTTGSQRDLRDTVSHKSDIQLKISKTNQEHVEIDLTFLSECFFGVVDRYKKSIIDPILNLMYNANSQLKTQDKVTYSILIYLLITRLEELGLKKFRNLAKYAKLTLPRMVEFLQFLIDEEHINEWFVPEWEKSFDHAWVKDKLVLSLNNHRSAIEEWILSMQERIHGHSLTQEDLPQITIPEPFHLTVPTEKIIPQPMVIDTTFKAKDVPNSTYECEDQVIKVIQSYKEGKKEATIPESLRQKHKEEFQKKLKDPLFKRVKEVSEKNSKKNEIKAEKMKKKNEEILEDNKPKITSIDKLRKLLNEPANVRYNAAALLREDALIKQKQVQEANILKKYESELRDSSKFFEWQEEMKKRDDVENKLRIQQRKLEMELVDARAKQAKIEQEEKNKLDAIQLKEDVEKKLEILRQEREKEVIELKDKASKLQEKIKNSVNISKNKNKKEKEEIAESLRRQKHKMELILARQMELERQRKEDIVLQVKAQESVKPIPETKFDPTEAKGDGLLGEMSYLEMRQRLEMQKQQEEELKKQKREQIEKEREKKRQELLEKSEKITERRKLAQDESKKKKIEKLRLEYKNQALIQKDRDEKLMELQQKIQEHKEKRKQEREQQKEEEKQRLMKAKFMGAAKRDQEINKWKQQEEGRNREAFQRAREAKLKFEDQQTLKQKERTITLQNARKVIAQKEKTLQQIDESIREKHQLHLEEQEIQDTMLKQNARIRHGFEVLQRENLKTLRNPLEYGIS